jgi:hypothetical protein
MLALAALVLLNALLESLLLDGAPPHGRISDAEECLLQRAMHVLLVQERAPTDANCTFRMVNSSTQITHSQ